MRKDSPPPEPPAGGCPFKASSSSSTTSGEALDPRNMMPRISQNTAPGQRSDLSKFREVSTIPMADEDGNWVYPSSQQFYNALLRKDKEAEAETMDAVVFAHNVTNERTWQKIMEWEAPYARWCPAPKLVRFVGRPQDVSFGAWWATRLSYRGAPFDRHDWFVDRCGYKQVRYVIDYYDDPRAGDELEIAIDARPGVDSGGAVWERLRRPFWQVKRMTSALFGYPMGGP